MHLPSLSALPQVVAWRDVPVDERAVGPIALKTMPRIRQVFIESGAGLTGDELERALFIGRKRMAGNARMFASKSGPFANDRGYACCCCWRRPTPRRR